MGTLAQRLLVSKDRAMLGTVMVLACMVAGMLLACGTVHAWPSKFRAMFRSGMVFACGTVFASGMVLACKHVACHAQVWHGSCLA